MSQSNQFIPITQESKQQWEGLHSKNVHLAQRKHLTMKGQFKFTLGSEPLPLKGKVHFPERLGMPIDYKPCMRIFNHRYESQINFSKTEMAKGFGFIPCQKKYNATKFLSYLNKGQKTKLQMLYDEVKVKRSKTNITPSNKFEKSEQKLPFVSNEKGSSLSVKQLNQNKLTTKAKEKMEMINEDRQSVQILADWTKQRKQQQLNE